METAAGEYSNGQGQSLEIHLINLLVQPNIWSYSYI